MKQIIIGLVITALVLVGLWNLIPVDQAQAHIDPPNQSSTTEALSNQPLTFAQGPFDGKTLGVRISGLVCDLCISDIEKSIQKMTNVVGVKAFPRDGVVVISLQGEPDQRMIETVLKNEGYNVHAFALSEQTLELASENPSEYAKQLWEGGASEQILVMSTPEGRVSTCEQKKDFSHYQQVAWGQEAFLETPTKK